MVDQKDYFEIFFGFRISRKFISMPICSEWVEQEWKSHGDTFRNWERCNWICVIGRSIDRSFVRTWCGSLTWGSHRVQWKRKNVWTWTLTIDIRMQCIQSNMVNSNVYCQFTPSLAHSLVYNHTPSQQRFNKNLIVKHSTGVLMHFIHVYFICLYFELKLQNEIFNKPQK